MDGQSKITRVSSLAFIFLVLFASTSLTPQARSNDREAKLKQAGEQSAKAAKAFNEIMRSPDKSVPRGLLKRAKAVAVFPGVVKAGFMVGAEGGRGVVTRRTVAGWGDPIFFRAGGPSFGAQIGVSAADIVLVFMNDDAVGGLMKDRFELGADAAVAGGPVGRDAGAGTDALMQAQILSYSRSRGLFVGVSLKGIVIRPEDDLNRAVYSKTARELLKNDSTLADTHGKLVSFPQAVAQYAPTEKTTANDPQKN
jgi:SH3 domain-containing YSC84-like protein 1